MSSVIRPHATGGSPGSLQCNRPGATLTGVVDGTREKTGNEMVVGGKGGYTRSFTMADQAREGSNNGITDLWILKICKE